MSGAKGGWRVSIWTVGFLLINLALVAVAIALPLGMRTIRQTRIVNAPAGRIWQALFPLGDSAGFDGEIVSVRPVSQDSAWLSFSWRGRDDRSIERQAVFEDVRPGEHFRMRFAEDKSVQKSFWKGFRQSVDLKPVEGDPGSTEVTMEQVDSYRGAAFLIFRHFMLRRKIERLSAWAETGVTPTGGITLEHPLSQVGFAVVSALLVWPLFGFTMGGLAGALLLTAVIAVHELGHVAAFRIVGHRSARMLFIPLLGGVAIGDRPYDKKFEVGFVALMGPGFSAFLVALCIIVATVAAGRGADGTALVAGTVGGLLAVFNLANMLPVWRFDGAQVLRQITGHWQVRVAAELALLLPFVAVAWALGSSPLAIAIFLAGTITAAVLTRNAIFKPRRPLKKMSALEASAVCAGLTAVVAVHAMGVLWAAERLF